MDALRTDLERHREGLRREIAAQGADPDSAELAVEFERGFADGAHSTAERAQRMALAHELRESLLDVERALQKMDAGAYGSCERCGEPVSPERLEALPWARLCITCKQRSR
jgi:RNA polymerase-binding transcription factor DksA